MVMVAMSSNKSCEAEEGGGESHFGAIGDRFEARWRREKMREVENAREAAVNTIMQNMRVSIILRINFLPLCKEL